MRYSRMGVYVLYVDDGLSRQIVVVLRDDDVILENVSAACAFRYFILYIIEIHNDDYICVTAAAATGESPISSVYTLIDHRLNLKEKNDRKQQTINKNQRQLDERICFWDDFLKSLNGT